MKVGHRTHLNRAILAGHGLPLPPFFFLFFFLVHTDVGAHGRTPVPCHSCTYLYFSGTRWTALVGDRYTLLQTFAWGLVMQNKHIRTRQSASSSSSSSSLSSGQSRPLASTCLPKQTTRHFIRSIHLRLVSNLRLFCLFSVFNCVIGKRISHFLRREEG